ncbi:MAG: hypothetical protein PHI42_04590 [Paludibacteraceae bacterium]|nr:hypothetical protein [Paludibacteraceae bacterium]
MKKQIKSTEIYIDAEWFISQEMYLLGYAYDLRNYGQLYGRPLNRANVIKLLKNVTTVTYMKRLAFRSTFLSSYNYFLYELCRSNTHCTGN